MKTIMKSIIAILSVFLLYACTDFRPSEKYQISSSTDGNVYRLDKASGEVWLIKGNSMEQIRVKPFMLKAGQQYNDEAGYSFTYLGNGRMGDIKANPFDNPELEKKK